MAHYFTKNGKDIEIAKNMFDLVMKKSGLDEFFDVLVNIVKTLLKNVESYPVFIEVKKKIDEILSQMIMLLSAVMPIKK